jgi:regulator of replication initiation timing
MSLSKETLTEINQKLQVALQSLREENRRLQEENAKLTAALSRMERQWKQQIERYQKLTDYIQSLRTWLKRGEVVIVSENDEEDEK